jgi:hypothetical protein
MPRTKPRSGLAANLTLALVALGFSLALAELGFQLFARLVIFPGWDRDMARPNFFLARSEAPVLAYELAPGYELDQDGRRLHVNRYGLRADSDDRFEERRKLAVLGDSVTMGAGHSQEQTITYLLEEELRAHGADWVVLNFGVPGYGTHELAEYLKRKDSIYHVDDVVYVLNPNDFARRDSVYEGADNGLYRMFVRPTWQTPWFLRKSVYRIVKGGAVVSPRWYRWLFAGNEVRAQVDIRDMAASCAAEGASFSVVLLPSGISYGPDGYALDEMYARLTAFLTSEGIPVLTPIDAFRADPGRYFDESDHLYAAGNERLAELIAEFVASRDPSLQGATDAADPMRSRSTGSADSATARLPAGFRWMSSQ